jgi:hypothetical protein
MQLSNLRHGYVPDAIRKLPTRVGFQGESSAVDVGQIIALQRCDLGVFRSAFLMGF